LNLFFLFFYFFTFLSCFLSMRSSCSVDVSSFSSWSTFCVCVCREQISSTILCLLLLMCSLHKKGGPTNVFSSWSTFRVCVCREHISKRRHRIVELPVSSFSSSWVHLGVEGLLLVGAVIALFLHLRQRDLLRSKRDLLTLALRASFSSAR
jgi:hypothetical protein